MAETSESRASSSLSFHLTDFSGALPWDSFNSWNSFQGLLTNANQLYECGHAAGLHLLRTPAAWPLPPACLQLHLRWQPGWVSPVFPKKY